MRRGIVDCMPTNTHPDTRPKCNHKTVCGSPLLTHPGRQARAVVLAQVLQQPVAAQELHGQAVQQAAMEGGRWGKGRKMPVLLIAAGAWQSLLHQSAAHDRQGQDVQQAASGQRNAAHGLLAIRTASQGFAAMARRQPAIVLQ